MLRAVCRPPSHMSNKMAAAPPGLSSMSRKEKEVKEEKGMNSYIRKTKAFSEILSRFMNELHHVATVNCKEVWEVTRSLAAAPTDGLRALASFLKQGEEHTYRTSQSEGKGCFQMLPHRAVHLDQWEFSSQKCQH